MKIYKLQSILDDPRFEGFGCAHPSFSGGDNIVDDFMPVGKSATRKPKKLAHIWRPVPVTGRVRPSNDFPCINLLIPAFSHRAVDALRDLLEPNGEILPLDSKSGKFYAYNATTIVDALDKSLSEVIYFSSSSSPDDVRAMDVEEYAFVPFKVQGVVVFRIPQLGTEVFVTDVFEQRVRENNLQGFDLQEVWSQDSPVQASGSSSSRLSSAKSQSVVIDLKLRATRPYPQEKKRIGLLMDELDQLLVQDLDAPLLGNLEGNEFTDGKCRLSLSCPDASVLIKRLGPWLLSLKWPNEVVLVKRDGEYFDLGATEVKVSIDEV